MTTYTVFMSNLRAGTPMSPDGITYSVPASADAFVLDENNNVQSPWGMDMPWAAVVSVNSVDALGITDNLNSARAKVMSQLRNNFPQIQANDLVRVTWLDNGNMLNLNLAL